MLFCRRLNSSNSAHGTFIIIGTLFNLFIPVIPTLHSNSPCSLISNSFLLLNDYVLSAYVPTKCSLSFWEHDFEFLYVRCCTPKYAIAFLAHFYPSLHLLKNLYMLLSQLTLCFQLLQMTPACASTTLQASTRGDECQTSCKSLSP